MDNSNLKSFFKTLTPEEIANGNEREEKRFASEYNEFISYFNEWKCNICKKSLKVFSSETPCLHYLLHLNKDFKKKHFKKIFQKWGYFNIACYLRWVANLDKLFRNINNLEEEKNPSKKFEYTVRWKNIEWTFSCDYGDFSWHKGTGSNFQHYHFQMRIDKKSFIDFTDFHIPFSNEDLFNFSAIDGWLVNYSWNNGYWMQEIMELMDELPGNWLDNMSVSLNEEDAQFHIGTFITWPIKWDDLAGIVEEANQTGKTISSIAKKRFWENQVITTISPIETLPDIAWRQRVNRQKK